MEVGDILTIADLLGTIVVVIAFMKQQEKIMNMILPLVQQELVAGNDRWRILADLCKSLDASKNQQRREMEREHREDKDHDKRQTFTEHTYL